MNRDEWRKEVGRRSEEVALDYLLGRGLRLRDRNYYVREGELDLVMEMGDVVVVVEVRSATTRYLHSPGQTVNSKKQAHVVRATEAYIRRFGLTSRPIRFDVVAVRWLRGVADVEWIQDAFRPAPTALSQRFR